jgi:hypothetical protein
VKLWKVGLIAFPGLVVAGVLRLVAQQYGLSLLVVTNDSPSPRSGEVVAYYDHEALWRGTLAPHARAFKVFLVSGEGGLQARCASPPQATSEDGYLATEGNYVISADLTKCPTMASVNQQVAQLFLLIAALVQAVIWATIWIWRKKA